MNAERIESALWVETLFWPLLGVLVALALLFAGCLRGAVFDRVPPRRVGLTLHDVLSGTLIMMMGMMAMVQIQLWIAADGDTLQDPVSAAGWSLGNQALTQLPVVLFVLYRTTGGWRRFGLWSDRPLRHLVAASLALLAAVPIVFGLIQTMIWLGDLFQLEPPAAGHALIPVLQEKSTTWAVVGLLSSVVLVAPLLEEIIFRGLVQTALESLNPGRRRWGIIVIAAAWFALIHAGSPWQVMPSLFVLGMMMGWLYERYGSLFPAVLLHAGFNATNAAIAMAQGAGGV